MASLKIKKLNNKGAALIIAYFVMAALVTLSTAFALTTSSELNSARRYRDGTAAFWLAEAGVSLFLHNVALLDDAPGGMQTIPFASGTIYLSKDDSRPAIRVVTSKGIVNGIERSIQMGFPAEAPEVFNNTMSAGGNIAATGNKSTVVASGKTRLSGRITNKTKHGSIFFEDKQEGLNSNLVALTYPDANKNGISDEFGDFVEFNRNLLSSYPPGEVLYIKGNASYTLAPGKSISGKTIIYVEGSQGSGDVNIQLSGALDPGQNLTVITTGKVKLNLLGAEPNDAQLNVISWGDYSESGILPSVHNGAIFTHSVAKFDEIHDSSVTNGTVIANGGISIREVWATKVFNYKDVRDNGLVPPGFEGLLGGAAAEGYVKTPNYWKEI